MKIILLEFVEEAERFLDKYGKEFNRSGETIFISLNPKVESFLKSKGIASKNSIDYFPNSSHKTVIEKTEAIIQVVLNRCALKDGLSVSNTYMHFLAYHVRFYIIYFFVHLEIINNAFREFQSPEIVTFHQPAMVQRAFIDPSERFLGVLAERFCKEHSGTVRKINERISILKFFKNLSATLFFLVAAIYFHLYYNTYLKRQLKKTNSLFISATWGYKFGELVQEIQKRHPSSKSLIVHTSESAKRTVRFMLMSLASFLPFFKKFSSSDYSLPLNLLSRHQFSREDQIFGSELKSLARLVKGELGELFSHYGVNVADLVAQKIEGGLRLEMMELKQDVECLRRIYQDARPKVVISPSSVGFHYAMGELTQLLGIESCILSHGTHVPPNNIYEEIENYWLARGVILNDYKTVAVQSPWTDRFLSYYRDQRERVYCGSIVLSKTKKTDAGHSKEVLGFPPNARIALYATTQKTRHGVRLYITETLDEFMRSLSDIVRAVNKFPNLYLAIRPHPSCDFSESDFKRLLPESDRFRIVASGKFEDALSYSDVLVSYSSTCIEEALMNEIPVILYDRWQRYSHFNLKPQTEKWHLEKSPVCYVTDPSGLESQLRYFLEAEYKVGQLEKSFAPYRYDSAYQERFFDYIKSIFHGVKQNSRVESVRQSVGA